MCGVVDDNMNFVVWWKKKE